MLRTSLILTSMLSLPAVAKDLNSNRAVKVDQYFFYESSFQPNMLLMLGKTETVVSSKTVNTTTSGIPVRSWVIKTQWVDNREALRAALDKAIAKHPEWESFSKSAEEVNSAYCKFNLKDPNIKVSQGDRSTSLSSTSELCTYVVHTKDDGDQLVLEGVAKNNLIDSGLEVLRVSLKGESKVVFDGKKVADFTKDLITDPNKIYSEKEASYLLGASFALYNQEMIQSGQINHLDGVHQSESLGGLNALFPKIFTKPSPTANSFKFFELSTETPISIQMPQAITFDPQGRE